jgi:nucleotidyltransferase substrate binding protein (TIGR01987 family)
MNAMSPDNKWQRVIYNEKQFKSALETLGTAIREPNFNEYVRDAVIQRFEYTYETAWKAIKSLLAYQGIELRYPKEMFTEAFAAGWIEHPDHWDSMIEDRNLTTHTYKERTAEMVYHVIKSTYYPELCFLQQSIAGVIRKYAHSAGKNQD